MRSVFRILDASLNRAREALRVLEDLARFHRNDAEGAAALKSVRHELDAAARPLARPLLEARDAEGDVGRDGDVPARGGRSAADVAEANFKRAQEALRAIEELSKGRVDALGRTAHRLRFRCYGLQKEAADPRRRLAGARLCVLLDPAVVRRSLERLAEAALRGGADMLQLRQKPRVDAGLARALRAVARDAIFIVNDGADVALACGADGVHLGRGDLPVREARRLGLGLVGATTHSLAEARRVVAAGADYFSVGPMYATERKPGLPPDGFRYLAEAKRLGVPFFCIGGITRASVKRSMERVAVCGGVILQKDPAAAARAIRRRLTSRT